MAGALVIGRLLPMPSGFLPRVAWWVALMVSAALPVFVVERAVRRWLPLTVLLKLSLVFPDRTPSRLRIAQQAARTRDLKVRLEESRRLGRHDEPTRVAERVLALIVSLGSHDRKTRGHSERVRVLADILAEKVRVPEADRDRFRWGALLHDIGKISVPPKVLNKPGRPDDREWSILRTHPAEGARMAGPLREWLGPWAGAIEHHHERYDGAGYPFGLAGKQISLGGRMLAVVDAYEVMTAARSYKTPMTPRAARQELARSAGTQFDPDLVRAFLDISVGRLIWVAGLTALLAQLPILGRLWSSRVVDRFGRAAAHTMVATALVAAVAVPNVVPRSPATGEHRMEMASRKVWEGLSPRGRSSPSEPPRGLSSRSGGKGEASGDVGSAPVGGPPARQDDEQGPNGGRPKEEEPEPAPPTYSATGRIKAGNPLSPGRGGVTLTEFLLSCGLPASQGLDGWVFELPSAFPERSAAASVRGGGTIGDYDLEMRFFSASCDFLGSVSTRNADEGGVLPAGTHFVVVQEARGIDTVVHLSVRAR
jgi:putative nucleotidyltransferase with HDIG domain